MRQLRVMILLLVAAASLALAGCGGDGPAKEDSARDETSDTAESPEPPAEPEVNLPEGDVLVTVGEAEITRDEFDHWLVSAAASQKSPCVGKLGEKPTGRQIEQRCGEEYEPLKDQVVQFLIQAEWVQQEAEEREIAVSGAEIDAAFAKQKKQSFPNEADYAKFLSGSGMTEEDIRFRIELDLLQNKLSAKVTDTESGKEKALNAFVKRFRAKYKAKTFCADDFEGAECGTPPD